MGGEGTRGLDYFLGGGAPSIPLLRWSSPLIVDHKKTPASPAPSYTTTQANPSQQQARQEAAAGRCEARNDADGEEKERELCGDDLGSCSEGESLLPAHLVVHTHSHSVSPRSGRRSQTCRGDHPGPCPRGRPRESRAWNGSEQWQTHDLPSRSSDS